MTEHKFYPETKAKKIWQIDDMQFSIVFIDRSDSSWYCGYVRFPKKLFNGEVDYRGFLSYIPVHGGITFAEQDKDGSVVYGFDCNHLDDETDGNLRNIDWLTKHCEYFGKSLKECKSFKRHYDRVKSNKKKAEIIDAFHEKFPDESERYNFGTMLNLLSGKL